jgi:outer membrane protein
VKNIFGIVNLLLILALGSYLVFNKQQADKKEGYIVNQRIFDGFKGKVELEQKLMSLRNANKVTLDSLAKIVQANPKNRALIEHYDKTAHTMELEDQQRSAKYTSDAWKRINQYIAEYGKQYGYDFIFGATGEGNLMYAENRNDITDEVIAFINQKYQAD